MRFDTSGNAVDAHDGKILYNDGVYYLYGTSYDYGFEWQNKEAPFCGFKVYTSKDLNTWEDKGFLFDAQTEQWQCRCDGKTYGCFRPHVIYNKQTNNYVLWVNVYDNVVGFRVFTAKTPIDPFNEVAEPNVAVNNNMPAAGLNNGDHDLFVDDDGTAYLAYTDWRAKGAIVIEKLSDDYLTGTGEHIESVTESKTEAPCLIKREDKYYMLYSDPNCGYCSGTGTSYRMAPSPFGPWSEPKKISENSCGGQPSFVSTIKINSENIYIYGSDLWNNRAKNEALANYFWIPLSFNADGEIEPINCAETYDVRETKPYIVKSIKSDLTERAKEFVFKSDISRQRYRYQSFLSKDSGKLDKIDITLFKNNHPNDDLIFEIYKTNKKNKPIGAALFTKNIQSIELGWSPKNFSVFPNIDIKKEQRYAIVLHSNTTNGSYGFVYSNYISNNQCKQGFSADGGKTYTIEPNYSLKFKIYLED